MILHFVQVAEFVFLSILLSFMDKQHCGARQPSWTLTRQAILALRATVGVLDLSTQRYIASLGCAVSTDPAMNTQAEFDNFYSVASKLMDEYYPEQTVTLSNRDPYMTPNIQSMLRRKNKLVRAGRVEEAVRALSARIGQAIQRRCKQQLCRYDGKTDAAKTWAAVRRLTGRKSTPATVDGVTAEVLNRHYADISTDSLYVKPPIKSLDNRTFNVPQCVSEWELCRKLVL